VDITTKAADVRAVESDHPHGEFDVILSTKSRDRDGDELLPGEWKTPLPEHITFDSDHGMNVATCVGSGKPFINDDGQLQVRGTFASTPHAQNVRTLVNEGHIRSVSVSFMQRKGTKDAKVERELLNGAFVAVPANPEAMVLSSKSAAPTEGHWCTATSCCNSEKSVDEAETKVADIETQTSGKSVEAADATADKAVADAASTDIAEALVKSMERAISLNAIV
jgi:HK97 family phage prohead protease